MFIKDIHVRGFTNLTFHSTTVEFNGQSLLMSVTADHSLYLIKSPLYSSFPIYQEHSPGEWSLDFLDLLNFNMIFGMPIFSLESSDTLHFSPQLDRTFLQFSIFDPSNEKHHHCSTTLWLSNLYIRRIMDSYILLGETQRQVHPSVLQMPQCLLHHKRPLVDCTLY